MIILSTILRFKPSLLFISIFFQYFNIIAQINIDNQQWIQYYNQLELTPKYSLYSDGGLRWKDAFREPSQYIARTGIYYNHSNKLTFGTGFANSGYLANSYLSKVEFRPYQEILNNLQCKKTKIQQRIRIEERFFHPYINHQLQRSNQFILRFRYRIQLNLPIFEFHNSKRILSLNVADEIFLNSGKGMSNSVFDQNRFIIGPALKLSEIITFNFTYNGQYSKKTSGMIFEHIFWLGMTHKLKISNKKVSND